MMFSGWVNRHQLDLIDYIQEENRLLKERLADNASASLTPNVAALPEERLHSVEKH